LTQSKKTERLSFKLTQALLYVFWYIPGYILCLIVFRLLSKTRVYDKPAFGLHRGYLLVANHQSALDAWFVGHFCFPRPVWFPAKSELFDIPIVKHVIAGWRAFPVKRKSHDFQAMSFTSELLERYIVLIHPEGTRNPTRQLKPGKLGVGKIIHDAQCTVIPVYFEGMDRLLPKGRIFPFFSQELTIIFGQPIDLSHLYQRESSIEVSQAIVDTVMENIAVLQTELVQKLKA